MTLPKLSPLTHLAVAQGCGGTTLAMQFARDTLLDGGRVIWICESSPDAKRFSQLFEQVGVAALAKLHLQACGEGLSGGIDDARKLSSRLTPQLVVIDDWTPRTGQADKLAISSVKELKSTLDAFCPILIISSLYEDATGKGQWKVRGETMLEKLNATTWVLTMALGDLGGVQKRLLKVEDEQYHLIIDEGGYFLN